MGIIFLILSAFFFTLMNVFVRLSGDLPSIEKSFFRNLIAMLFALVLLIKSGGWFSGKRENIKFVFLRAGVGTIGIICNFYAVDHLVLSDASLLNKMSPFFAIIFSLIILKEHIKKPQIAIVIGAFIGCIFVIKPTSALLHNPASLVGLLGGIAAGLAYTYVRVLGEGGEKGAFVVFSFSAFSTLVTLPYLIFFYHPMRLIQLILLLLAGISAACGQLCITAAYFHAPAKEISIYDYSQIIFSAFLGFAVFQQVPDHLSWIGYIIICTMAFLMYWYNTNTSRHQE